jgi:hypothetical protein
MNKNTSTSNSRSAKKPSTKKVSTETIAQTDSVVSAPVQVVEKTVDVTSDITGSTTVEVVAEPTKTPSAELAETVSKPMVNIWELRKQARAAEEALKKANEATVQVVNDSKPEIKTSSKPKVNSSESAKAPNADDDKAGWTKVDSKKSTTKPAYKPKQSSENTKPAYKSDKFNKPAYKPKQPSEEELARRELKNKALIVAQDKLINECVGQLHPKARDDINNSLPYVINYRRTVVLKFDNDAVVADVNEEKFEFSRTKFFENRIFQDKVRERFDSIIPEAWIRFFPGRDENTYCMGIMRRRASADADAEA